MNSKPQRMWVNQPSTSQPMHELHGKNVLAVPDYPGSMTIYHLSGEIISSSALSLWLSPGWVNKRPLDFEQWYESNAKYIEPKDIYSWLAAAFAAGKDQV